jgi:hypothetical protein
MWTLFIAPAVAAGIHTGIPVDHGIEGLGEVAFQTAARGWTADFKKGLVRVFVGQDEAAAEAWIAESLVLIERQNPSPMPQPFGDASWGDPVGLMLWRDGNIGVLIQCTFGAQEWSERLLAAIVDEPSPPLPPPQLTALPGPTWSIQADPGALHVAWQGGSRIASQPLLFDLAPNKVVIWDQYGRAVVQFFDREGRPISTPKDPIRRATVPSAAGGG